MKFCHNCGGRLVEKIPPDDDRPRLVCESCGTVHYRNPTVVVGCIPEAGDKILLCRRAIEPARGLWTLPAGFLENGETPAQDAAREALEETGSRVEIGDLFSMFTVFHIHQIYLIFRASLLDHDFGPTGESLEVRLFGEEEIPWSEIAFSSIRQTLRLYFQDKAQGEFRVHEGSIR